MRRACTRTGRTVREGQPGLILQWFPTKTRGLSARVRKKSRASGADRGDYALFSSETRVLARCARFARAARVLFLYLLFPLSRVWWGRFPPQDDDDDDSSLSVAACFSLWRVGAAWARASQISGTASQTVVWDSSQTSVWDSSQGALWDRAHTAVWDSSRTAVWDSSRTAVRRASEHLSGTAPGQLCGELPNSCAESSRKLSGRAPRQLSGTAPRQLSGTAPRQLSGTAPRQLSGTAPRQWSGTVPRQWSGTVPREIWDFPLKRHSKCSDRESNLGRSKGSPVSVPPHHRCSRGKQRWCGENPLG